MVSSSKVPDSEISVFQEILENKLYQVQNFQMSKVGFHYRPFRSDEWIQYYPFCDDFGPMNIGSVVRFIERLEREIHASADCKIVYQVENGKRALTNSGMLAFDSHFLGYENHSKMF